MGPATPIRIRIPNVSEKFLVSVIRNQSFREIFMTSYVSRRVSISQRAITLSCCVTNQSVTRFRNSHYRLLATHTHTHARTHNDTVSVSLNACILANFTNMHQNILSSAYIIKDKIKAGVFHLFCVPRIPLRVKRNLRISSKKKNIYIYIHVK
jgi:hypothetical protein